MIAMILRTIQRIESIRKDSNELNMREFQKVAPYILKGLTESISKGEFSPSDRLIAANLVAKLARGLRMIDSIEENDRGK